MLVVSPLVGPETVAPEYKSPVSIFIYRAPDWKREVVTGTLSGLVHGIEPVSWPGVRGQALLSAGFMGIHLYRFANAAWSQTALTSVDPQPWPKSNERHPARPAWPAALHRDHRAVARQPEVVIYSESGDAWQRLPIDDTLNNGHGLAVLDVDGDGRDEVVAGQRGGTRSLILYRSSGMGGTWTRRVLDEGGMAGAGCATADLNADTRPDIVCIGTATANLKSTRTLGRNEWQVGQAGTEVTGGDGGRTESLPVRPRPR